jgi:hypothetical protein
MRTTKRMAPIVHLRHGSSEPRPESIEEWSWLETDVLHLSASHRVCMTCHWFGHEAGPNCIPDLVCGLHQGLVMQGEHLIRGCEGWSDYRQVDRPVA